MKNESLKLCVKACVLLLLFPILAQASTATVNGVWVVTGARDWNSNGVIDAFEDFNGNGIPDAFEDFNGSGTPDAFEDFSGSGIPDAFELDFNNNGIPDVFEFGWFNGVFTDFSGDGYPDALTLLNDQGVPFVFIDYNGSGIPDAFEDFNDNGFPDAFEDFNGSFVPDAFESGFVDTTGSGIPDFFETIHPSKIWSLSHPSAYESYVDAAFVAQWDVERFPGMASGWLWLVDRSVTTSVGPENGNVLGPDVDSVTVPARGFGRHWFHLVPLDGEGVPIPNAQARFRFDVDIVSPAIGSASHPQDEYWYNSQEFICEWASKNAQHAAMAWRWRVDAINADAVELTADNSTLLDIDPKQLVVEGVPHGSHRLTVVPVDMTTNIINDRVGIFHFNVNTNSPIISSTTHPDPNETYLSQNVVLLWSVDDVPSESMSYYHYLWTREPYDNPTAANDTVAAETITFEELEDGSHYFHIAGVDQLGNLTYPGRLRVNIKKITGPLAGARQYYVSPYGNDSNDGLSWQTAKQSIQSAIDVASLDSTIWVTNGTYVAGGRVAWDEDSQINRVVIDKAVTVRSVNGPEHTFIVGCHASQIRGVWMTNGAQLVGFTLANGSGVHGGGVWAQGDEAIISNCVIIGNSATSGGGAFGGTFYNCVISENTAASEGGGAFGGLLYNCTVAGNMAPYGAGLLDCVSVNCIVYYNSTDSGYHNYAGGTLMYSCTWPMPASGTGNITHAPLIASFSKPRLLLDSPCINAGTNQPWMDDAFDMDGRARIRDGIVDMGAYEHHAGTQTGQLSIAAVAMPEVVVIGNPVTFRAVIEGQCTGYSWDFGTGQGSHGLVELQHYFMTTGIHSVALSASNLSMNVSTTITVQVLFANQYVSPSGGHEAPFDSWETAATNIQAAIDVAYDGDVIAVTNGVYNKGVRNGSRVVIDKQVTVRSVNGPEYTFIVGSKDPPVRCVWMTAGAKLAGFTLTNGAAADEHSLTDGGGVWCQSPDAIVSNCVIAGNSSLYYGGGGAYGGTLLDCTLTGNTAVWEGGGAYQSTLYNCILERNVVGQGGAGGAVSESTLYDCVLRDNSAKWGGGASWSTLHNCRILDNWVTEHGGGATWSTLYNCVVSGNSAAGEGGGTYGGTLFNCAITDNSAARAGGSRAGVRHNSIVYYNRAEDETHNYTGGIFWYSCTYPMPEGGSGNITNSPSIVSFANPRLLPGSLCINAGTNQPWMVDATDLSGRGRIYEGTVDIGPYEFHSGVHTGTLSVAVSADWSTVVLGRIVQFTAHIEGECIGYAWSFGDGLAKYDSPRIEYSFDALGEHAVVLFATNSSMTASATVTVHVVATELFVSPSGSHEPPYDSWTTAATNIQAAIDEAPVGGIIWVADGVYDRGGRAAAGEHSQSNRVTIDKPITIRSLNGPEHTTIVGSVEPPIRCVWMANGARLIGFTLTNGFAESGGGAWCQSSSVVISNCVISGNAAISNGGGVYGGTLYDCTITGNTASYGGGVYSNTLYNSTLSRNHAETDGGGAYQSTLYSSVIAHNSAVSGGGLYGGTLYNCIIFGNLANIGGATYLGSLYNCTMTGNQAASAGGAYASTIHNSILYYNQADDDSQNYRWGSLSHTCTWPLPSTGEGNITNAPLFTALGTGYGTNYVAGDYRLQEDSPCINAGINQAWMIGAKDVDGNLRVMGNRVDMGAYEFDKINRIYVSPDGDDTQDGLAWTSAKQSIQVAIDLSRPGDIIWVTNGVYEVGGRPAGGDHALTNRIVIDKPVTVRSVRGPEHTIIIGAHDTDGSDGLGGAAVRCVWMTNGASLIGFTLQGGGTWNSADDNGAGGGVWCQGDLATIENCVIVGNTASRGGGLFRGTLRNSMQIGNSASMGGGAFESQLYNCTITGNMATQDGGGVFDSILENCIVYYNLAAGNYHNYYEGALSYSCAWPMPSSGMHNITNEPLFIVRGSGYGLEHVAGDNRLREDSPCIDAGKNQAWMHGATDIDGYPRIVGTAVDMGVYEYSTHIPNLYVTPHGDDENRGFTWLTAKQTIQAAIDAASAGDTVWVTNGVYNTGGHNDNRVFIDKPLTLRSVNGPINTIIVGSKNPDIRGVWMADGAQLIGFTVTNGAAYEGGGVWSQSSSTIISNCVITGNVGVLGGGSHGGTLYNSTVAGNTASWGGGGAHTTHLYNCLIKNNVAVHRGGGVAFTDNVDNCTIIGNTAPLGGGTFRAYVRNSIVYYNHGSSDSYNYDVLSTLRYSCSYPLPFSWGSDNISDEPQFVSFENPRLQAGSPCINAGQNREWMVGATDLAGLPRIYDGIVDMGAYEFVPGTQTGSLAVAISASASQLTRVEAFRFTAHIEGECSHYAWDFGDGNTADNVVQSDHIYDHPGTYEVILSASNSTHAAVASITVEVVSAQFYVSASGSHSPPYDTWETAATNIQTAVDAAQDAEVIWVANGIYNTGGRAGNRLYIDKPVTVQSINGPEYTSIVGSSDPEVRCVWMVNGAQLIGFTVTNGAAGLGGGIRGHGPDSVVSNCVIVGNHAGYGGGGWEASFFNCIVKGNSAGGWAGGVAHSTLYDCTVEDNSAVTQGGGASDSTAYNSVFRNNNAQYGGGAVFSVLSNCVVEANIAEGGAGVSFCTVYDSTLVSNHATLYGGGSVGGKLYNCVVISNTATESGGGMNSGAAYDTVFVGNSAEYGGAVVGGSFYNCVFESNIADHGGGANSSTLYDCVISRNSGCGVVASTLYNCILEGNTGTWGGAANSSTLFSSKLFGNTASESGGGAAFSTLYSSLVIGNEAVRGGGIRGGTNHNSTIVGNLATQAGGGASQSTLFNSIVYDNWSGSGSHNHDQSTFSYSCTWPMVSGTGNITNAPMFLAPGIGYGLDHEAGNYRLPAISPCVSAGTNLPWMTGGKDLAGNPRIAYGRVDMGAYESLYSIEGKQGPFRGGNIVIVHLGVSLEGITNVLVGGVSVVPAQAGSDWFTIIMPGAHAPGVVDFIVQTSDHDDLTLEDAYRYNPPGEINEVVPSSGSWTGGYAVAIGGSHLGDGMDVTNVTLCGKGVMSIVSQSSTQVVVVADQADDANIGVGDVNVFSTSFGETVMSNAFEYLKKEQYIHNFIPVDGSEFVITQHVALSASASSGLAVSFLVSDGPGVITHETNLFFMGVGSVSVNAIQEGNAVWNAASTLTNIYVVTEVPEPAFLVISPTSREHNASASSGHSIEVEANVPWTAESDQPWITISGGLQGSGNGIVSYDLHVNTGLQRSGTITLEGGDIERYFAVYQAVAQAHLDPLGGTVNPAILNVELGAPYGPLPIPLKPGYEFEGWWTAPTGGTVVTEDSLVSIEGDHTLYARWPDINYALRLDGTNQFLRIPYAPELDLGNTLTIEAWVKPDRIDDRHVIFSTGSLEEGAFHLEISSGSGGANRVALVGADGVIVETEDDALALGAWSHIAYVRSGPGADAHTLYINGVNQLLSPAADYDFTNPVTDRLIGAGPEGAHGFAGELEEVRIWGVARSADEIRDAMHLRGSGDTPGLVARYALDYDARDASPNHLHGQLMGDPEFVLSSAPFADAIAARYQIRGIWPGHPNSSSSSVLRFEATGIEEDQFLLFGHNGSPLSAVSDETPTNFLWRLERFWQVEPESLLNGQWVFNIEPLAGLITESGHLRLLASPSPDFADTSPYFGAVQDDQLVVPWNNPSGGMYFTIGEWNGDTNRHGGVPIPEVPDAYWPFDGDSLDHSGNQNHGTWTGGSFVEGRFGQAFEFEGTSNILFGGDYFSVSAGDALNHYEALSMAVWFKGQLLHHHGETLIGRHHFQSSLFDIWINEGNKVSAAIINTESESFRTPEVIVPTMNVQWHHYGFTYDGEQLLLYLDGVSVATNEQARGLLSAPVNRFFGINYHSWQSSSWSARLEGSVDAAYVFSRALSPTEMADLYAGTPPATEGFSYAVTVEPSVIPATGGELVTITGEDLGLGGNDITHVTLCGIEAEIISQTSSQVVVAAGMSMTALTGTVTVVSHAYGPLTPTNEFVYLAPPVWTVEVVSAHGQTDPEPGVYERINGEFMPLWLTNDLIQLVDTQLHAAAWTGTGSVADGVGTGATFQVLSDSRIEWLWTTSVWWQAEAGDHGAVDGPEPGWYPLGAPVEVEALPASWYAFDRWTGDIANELESLNPLQLDLDTATRIQAHFREQVTAHGTPLWWLAETGADPSDEGAEALAAGAYRYWEHHIAGTDPHDSERYFAIVHSPDEVFADSITIRWRSVEGRIYDVDRFHDLIVAPERIATGIEGQPDYTTFTDEDAAAPGLYIYRIGVRME